MLHVFQLNYHGRLGSHVGEIGSTLTFGCCLSSFVRDQTALDMSSTLSPHEMQAHVRAPDEDPETSEFGVRTPCDVRTSITPV